jgi:hypothetical protein
MRFEVFTAVTMKNAVFWDVAPCRSYVNRHFGGTYRLHLQGRKIRHQCFRLVVQSAATCSRWFFARGFSTLKMEAICSSEMLVHTRCTRRQISEDGILHIKNEFSM